MDKVLVIAEIGNNHNGCIARAKRLIRFAKECGADIAKFQMRNIQALYRHTSPDLSEDLGVEYSKDLINRMELTVENHRELKQYCDEIGIEYLCSPWDQESLNILKTLGISRLKLASADFENDPLIRQALEYDVDLILSTGMATHELIESQWNKFCKYSQKISLLHCVSTYPAPFQDIQLNYLRRLQELTPNVGYSGHERGIGVSIAAVGLGAKIIERHITEDQSLEGPDHHASLMPREFKMMVEAIREVELALGEINCRVKTLSQGALLNKDNLGKSIVASRPLLAGHRVLAEDLEVRSPGGGLSPVLIGDIIGRVITKSKDKHDFIEDTDFIEQQSACEKFPKLSDYFWGLPIRHHDLQNIVTRFNPKILEFHLSYSDLDLDIKSSRECLNDRADILIHAPEMFEFGQILDLCSEDLEYLQTSIENLGRVSQFATDLSITLKGNKKFKIIANVGGWSISDFTPEKKQELYERFYNSLEKIDFMGHQLLIQNMAPYPWHLGGQRFQNIFMVPDEIVRFCETTGMKICLDTSHLGMYCNFQNLDFMDCWELLIPYAEHIHIGDYRGLNGEGVALGTGDLPLSELTCKIPKNVSFILETWQGHRNNGEGFSRELKLLESLVGERACKVI